LHERNQHARRFTSYVFLIAAGVSPLLAAPTITSIQNAASNIPPGLPNAPVAQGSIFIIKGSGLGPATLTFAPAPFQSTSLSGTSVAVLDTVSMTTVQALMYYTSDSQVAALLPSKTPTGSLSFQVTYNSQNSAPVSHSVTTSVPGIFTTDSTGYGPAIVTFADYSLVSSFKAANCGGPNTTCGAANPGDTLILWATGLGPVSGNDASGSGLGVNMPNLPLKVWIGGAQASVQYQGRSGCCVGEDQIVFSVPNKVLTGCAVPLVVQIANVVSNTTPIPVAIGSRSCNILDPAIAQVDGSQATGTITLGDIELDHFLNNNNSGFQDFAQFNFATFTVPTSLVPFAGTYLANTPVGACTVKLNGSGANNPVFANPTPLDAGSKYTVSGPNGSMTVTASLGDQVTLSNVGAFLTPGTYRMSGSGGKDVGPFSVNVTIPSLPVITSPTGPANFSVSRSKGLTITWTPNGAAGHVEMYISSFINQNTGVAIDCAAPVSAGTFTIPDYVLDALPTGTGTFFAFQPGDGPTGAAYATSFSTSGLFFGLAQAFVDGFFFGSFPITN